MRYLLIIEEGPTSFGTCAPDLPGCVAVGSTRAEVSTLIQVAIEFHIEGLKEDGLEVPRPTSSVEHVEVVGLPVGPANRFCGRRGGS